MRMADIMELCWLRLFHLTTFVVVRGGHLRRVTGASLQLW